MSDTRGARNIEETTTGFVSDVMTQIEGASKVSTEQQLLVLVQQVRFILDGINGGLSFGNGKQSSRVGNVDAVNIQYNVVDTSVVLEIPHDLARKPVGYWVFPHKFTARSGGAVPILIPCGSDGDVLYGGGDSDSDLIPSDWDNRMVYFSAEGDAGWLPGKYRIVLW